MSMTSDPYNIYSRAGHGQPPHDRHYHVDPVFVNAAQPPMTINKINMPVIMAVVIGVFLMGITYAATNEFSDLKHAIDRLTDRLEQGVDAMGRRIDRIEKDLGERTADRWSKTDHEIWCARTEQLNSDINFKCAEGTGEKRRNKPINFTKGWQPK